MFMRGMLARLIDQLRRQTITPDGQKAVARFTDIVIQCGSSFALTSALSGTCPGRFTTIEPATVTHQLLLADRGYPSVAYVEAVAAHGGSFIARLTRSIRPVDSDRLGRGPAHPRARAHRPSGRTCTSGRCCSLPA